MHFLKRSDVCRLMDISLNMSYRLFPATKSRLIPDSSVSAFLNKSRAGGEGPVGEFVPSLRSPKSLSVSIGVEPEQVERWAHLAKPAPHFRIGGQTVRFIEEDVKAWAASEAE